MAGANALPTFKVISKKLEKTGEIILNRAYKRNSLSLVMSQHFIRQLREFTPEKTSSVLIKSSTSPFCAGTDVKAFLYAMNEGKDDYVRLSTKTNYDLLWHLANHPVPTVALVDGEALGTGAALMSHSQISVVTERARFGFPDITLGIAPHDGMGRKLADMQDNLGVLLALTGRLLRGRHIKKAGLANFYVSSHLLEKIEGSVKAETSEEKIKEILLDLQKQSTDDTQETFELDTLRSLGRDFKLDGSIEDLMDLLLEKKDSPAAKQNLGMIKRRSPTALKVTLESLKRAAGLETLDDVLKLNFRMAIRAYHRPDFAEGVHARLFKEPYDAVWKPDSLKDVSEDSVAAFFEESPHEYSSPAEE